MRRAPLGQLATLCRPNSKNGKRRLKLGRIGPLKNTKKGFDRSVDRPVELHFGVCFQQRSIGGWGLWLRTQAEGCGDRARLSPWSPKSHVIAVIGKPRTLTTMDTKEHKGRIWPPGPTHHWLP